MLETVGFFVAKRFTIYAFNKGLDQIFKDRNSFEKRLSKVIDTTIEQFKVENSISVEHGKLAFYDSQIFVDELLKVRFFSTKDHQFDTASISAELEKNPNIIYPKIKQVESFLEVFEQNIKKDNELKKLAEDENYKSEIFNMSEKLDTLLNILLNLISQLSKEIPKELTYLKTISKNEIIGRQTELQNLRNSLLAVKETALINGMGGIGKTTLASVYVSEFYEEYDHIAWITLENTLEEAIAADYALLTNLKLKKIHPNEQFEACLNELRILKSKKPKLLVLDNAKGSLATHYDKLPKAHGWHLLVTSRERIARFHIMDLDFLSQSEAIALFKKYNNRYATGQVCSIVNSVERHTLTIEILAKSSRKNRWDLEKVHNALSLDAKAGIEVTHNKHKIERVKTYLSSIFDLSNLSDHETYLLKQFTAFPNQWIKYYFLSELLQITELEWQEEFAAFLENIYEKGFILKDEETDSFKMHPVLVEVLIPCLKTTKEDIKLLIDQITGFLYLVDTKENPIDKFQFIPFGDAVLRLIPDDTSVETSDLKNHLAITYKNMGEYEKARVLLEESLKSAKENFGEKHHNVATIQSNLANVYSHLGEYEKARVLLEEALKSDLENFDEKHPSVAAIQSNLALVFSDLGEYEKARVLLEEALKSDLENFGDKHPSVAAIQSNLANVYSHLGEYEKACDLLEEALKSAKENFGEKHPDVAVRQSNLANVYSHLGEYEKARVLLEEALKSTKENFSEKHPKVAVHQSNLATVYYDLGKYEKARVLLEEALKSTKENFNEKHPEVAVRQSNLSLVYSGLGEYEKARVLLEEALKSDLENFGDKHPNVAVSQSNLALVFSDLGEYEKARVLLEEALKSDLENFGEKHPEVAARQSNLATVYSYLGEYEKARVLLEEALKSNLENFGEKHPEVAVSQSNLATVYSDLGEYEKARDLWSNSYDIFVAVLGNEHPHTKTVENFLNKLNKK